MRINKGLLIFLLALFFFIGCAPATTIVWTSTPDIQTISNQHYEAQFEPVTSGRGPFFDSFRLTLTNTTNKDLQIDWNSTRYVEAGKRFGGFVWEGINPDQVRDSSVPPDIVSPGNTFSRVIFPHRKLAYAPGYTRGEKIQGGYIPEGENGIDLVVRHDGKVIGQRIRVRITEETIKID